MKRARAENYLIRNMGYSDISPVICGQERCEPSHAFGPASREYYLLHFVVSGKGVFENPQGTYKVGASDCFLIKPHELTFYKADDKNPWHYIWIGFECKNENVLTDSTVIKSKQIAEVFRSVPNIAHMESGKEAYLCAKLWEIISILSEDEKPASHESQDYVEQAISCIETEYMMDISISQIAKRLSLDRSYFSTLFKKYTGVSPQQYLSDFRLEKAAELMTRYNYNVTQAALSTGYADVFSFSKMFKRKFGVSPIVYKKSQN